jgi:hypothetical protein
MWEDTSAVVWVVSAAMWVVYAGGIGWYVASAKGRGVLEGIILGVLAGPFGWLIVAILPAEIPADSPTPRAERGRVESERVNVGAWDTRDDPGMPKVRV